VVVSDRSNRFVPGLKKEDFRILQDGREQKIEVFGSRETPMSIVLALDTSISTKPVLGKIKNAAKEFVNGLAEGDRCMIVTFDSRIRRLSSLTTEKDVLSSAIKKIEAGKIAGTILNDALFEAISDTLKPISGRKTVIVLTDGKDYKSDHRAKDLMSEISETDTIIYPIYYETEQRAAVRSPRFFDILGRLSGRQDQETEQANALGRAFLQSLADATGGRLFEQKNDDVKSSFDQIAEEMKRQYLIGFYPPQTPKPGAVHKITVTVAVPDTIVRAKSEYKAKSN
jgi:VWFA-related protein